MPTIITLSSLFKFSPELTVNSINYLLRQYQIREYQRNNIIHSKTVESINIYFLTEQSVIDLVDKYKRKKICMDDFIAQMKINIIRIACNQNFSDQDWCSNEEFIVAWKCMYRLQEKTVTLLNEIFKSEDTKILIDCDELHLLRISKILTFMGYKFEHDYKTLINLSTGSKIELVNLLDAIPLELSGNPTECLLFSRTNFAARLKEGHLEQRSRREYPQSVPCC